VPRIADLGVFVRLLARNALGTPMTQYTSHFRKARRGGEMHIVIVDNGRSTRLGMEQFWTSLKCIRCGACMATCPVYRRSGGLSYDATYAGPIGLIINPTIDFHKYSSLPFASTLNGSCTNVCPVKINIHEQIFAWRKVISEKGELPLTKAAMMKAAGAILSRPKLYRLAISSSGFALRRLPHFVIYNRMNIWTQAREMPEAPRETFHSWWARNRGAKSSKGAKR
jgi:L-lactate dehydrogenase complex protein LldF